MGGAYAKPAFVREAAKQFVLLYKYLADIEFGLIYHVYYGDEGKRMGVLWGRGSGWFTAASADVLPYFQWLPEVAYGHNDPST
ncbi:hypothetical protein QD46_07730 [Paenibacillus polymyxa]|nr:hypothetical protein QD46_07730 [Paenibacillus polymyxa]